MLVATVPAIEGRPVQWYLGVVSGEAVAEAQPALARPGCEGGEEEEGGRCRFAARALDLRDAREAAIFEMLREAAERGANAVIGVGLGYEPISLDGGVVIMMVTASGTAVRM